MREYNKDDFWNDDGVMFARALAVLAGETGDATTMRALDRMQQRLGVSLHDFSDLLERATVATQRHDEACDEVVRAHDADPANRYGTEEHEAYLIECERTGVW